MSSSDPQQKASKTSDLVQRLVTAIIAIPILLLAAIKGPNWAVWFILAAAGGISGWEYLRMTLDGDFRLDGVVGVVAIVATLAGIYWLDDLRIALAIVFISAIGMLSAILFSIRELIDSGRRIGAILGGYVYITALFSAYVLLTAGPEQDQTWQYQAGWFLFPMFIIWAGDTGAYFVGRAFGKHKMAPLVSPGKSWEGAVGNVFFAALGGYISTFFLPLPEMQLYEIAIYAVPAAIIGQVGDLAESMVKRATGYKDSSRILYGHGGMLDRVDALIFAVPWIWMTRDIFLP